jgi:CRP/FNR family transcriptional regulator, nitrogen oxide reductase regulator
VPDKIRMEMARVPERPSNLAVLRSCSMFNALSAEDIDALVHVSFAAYAERGEMIWLAGAPSEYLAVAGAGFVKMTKSTPTGQEVAVELLGPGQCFGLFAALEGRPFPLNAVAVTNCWYLKIPVRDFLPIYQRSTSFKDQLIRSIAPRLRRAHDMMGRLSSGRVEERIAAVLFMLADSYGSPLNDGRIRIEVPLTRQDMSEMAGTTVETTIRILSRWQKEGLVCTDHHIVTILNENALLSILQVC